MTKLLYPALALLFLLTACEKEIDFDYHSIDPLYVIEGRITNETTEVSIAQTRDMENGEKAFGMDGAFVTVTANDGTIDTLRYEVADDYYRSANGLLGEPGKTYTLSVRLGENEFTSQSEMSGAVRIDSTYFYWMDLMGDKFLFYRLKFEDRAGEENYYCYRIYRNGKIYTWDVGRDKGNDGKVIEKNFLCMTEQTAEDNKREDWDEILYDGDIVDLEIQTIDRKTYDYLYALKMGENSSANPTPDFTNGALGYFSAYSTVRAQMVYKDTISVNP